VHAGIAQRRGSVEAPRTGVPPSGDLAPLAHLALVVIGEGEAFYKGERMAGGEALRRAGLQPLTLAAKEGLALPERNPGDDCCWWTGGCRGPGARRRLQTWPAQCR